MPTPVTPGELQKQIEAIVTPWFVQVYQLGVQAERERCAVIAEQTARDLRQRGDLKEADAVESLAVSIRAA
jgi:hypothetical protein